MIYIEMCHLLRSLKEKIVYYRVLHLLEELGFFSAYIQKTYFWIVSVLL